MSDFRTRLIDEKAKLDENIEKLSNFIVSDASKTIDSQQLSLLHVQEFAMRTYSQILCERIALLS